MTTLLYVDLKDGSINKEDASHLRKEYIGGIGINARILYDEVPEGTDPLSPQNVLIFGPGALIGTKLPTACRTEITSKSPLSHGFGTTNAGGRWGVNLRKAGFDHLIIKNKAPEPVILVIDDESVYLEKAEEIWKLDCQQVTSRLKNKFGSNFSIGTIGPAGENLVRYATIQNDFYASWGRTGMGAVMGSKNLKAVIVRGTKKISPVYPDRFKELKKEANKRIKEDPTFGATKKYGSMITSDPFNEAGALPGYNFNKGYIEDWENIFGRKTFAKNYKEKDVACYSCPVACAHWSKVKEEGPYKGYETKGLEITFTMEFGAKLGLKRVPEVFKCVELCNKMGMDVVSAAGSVAYLIESYKAGYLTKNELGIKPEWGDFESIYYLLEATAKREGIGDIAAEGVNKASEKYPDTKKFALHVKGVELPGRDPRAKMDVWSFGYISNSRGGDHLRCRSPVESFKDDLIGHKKEILNMEEEEIKKLDIPPSQKREIFEKSPLAVNIPAMAIYSENLINLINSVGFCIRPPILRSLGPDYYARAMNAFYGDSFTEESIYQASDKAYKLQHEFNQREGVELSSSFPERFYREELKAKKEPNPPLHYEKIKENLNEYLKRRNLI